MITSTTLDKNAIHQRLNALELLIDEQDREIAAIEATLNAAIKRPARPLAAAGSRTNVARGNAAAGVRFGCSPAPQV